MFYNVDGNRLPGFDAEVVNRNERAMVVKWNAGRDRSGYIPVEFITYLIKSVQPHPVTKDWELLEVDYLISNRNRRS